MTKIIYLSNIKYEYESLSELDEQFGKCHVRLGDGVRLGNDVRLGNWVRLGDGVRLGNDVRLGNWVSLGDGVRLGNWVSLGDDVRLGNGVRLGNDVKLKKKPLYIDCDLPYIFNGYNDRIQIGCKDFAIDYWLKNYKLIAESAGIANGNIINKYYQLIRLYSTWEAGNDN